MTEKTDAPPAAARPAGGRPATMERFVPDLLEHGAPVRGEAQTLETRLFVQLQVFTGCLKTDPIIEAVRASGLEAAVYANLNDPRGVGVVLMSEDPSFFAEAARALMTGPAFAPLTPMPDFTMIGRTYSSGRETDLRDFLLHRVRRQVLNPESPWGIWYPLRRIGAFNRLPRGDQGRILMEHGTVGRGYGELGLAADVRLECHGLDRGDNEFVIGLIGPELYPLSKLVKDMRPTVQTSEYIKEMGPFFVGRAIYQAPIPESAKLQESDY
ncbi:MAG: chlorite dismutase family protein [Acidobacteriota bacterium]|nr:chlorite dismutase family protein [Acidobacteriota bacterium]